jgi:hypothetical protein
LTHFTKILYGKGLRNKNSDLSRFSLCDKDRAKDTLQRRSGYAGRADPFSSPRRQNQIKTMIADYAGYAENFTTKTLRHQEYFIFVIKENSHKKHKRHKFFDTDFTD